LDRYLDVLTALQRQSILLADNHIFTMDPDCTTVRHGLIGVDQDIGQDLTDLTVIRINFP
jgi:hypothetical protein